MGGMEGGGGAVGVESSQRLLLAPDLFLECQEIILQITDDPFEVKLKANYEVHMYIICMHYTVIYLQVILSTCTCIRARYKSC